MWREYVASQPRAVVPSGESQRRSLDSPADLIPGRQMDALSSQCVTGSPVAMSNGRVESKGRGPDRPGLGTNLAVGHLDALTADLAAVSREPGQ